MLPKAGASLSFRVLKLRKIKTHALVVVPGSIPVESTNYGSTKNMKIT